jgi:hypothetical protein
MDEKEFKKHLRDLVHGHHHPQEHDLDRCERGEDGGGCEDRPGQVREAHCAEGASAESGLNRCPIVPALEEVGPPLGLRVCRILNLDPGRGIRPASLRKSNRDDRRARADAPMASVQFGVKRNAATVSGMPMMSGPDLGEALKKARPDLHVMVNVWRPGRKSAGAELWLGLHSEALRGSEAGSNGHQGIALSQPIPTGGQEFDSSKDTH